MKQDVLNQVFGRASLFFSFKSWNSAKAHLNGSTVGNLSGRLKQCNTSLAKWSCHVWGFGMIAESLFMFFWYPSILCFFKRTERCKGFVHAIPSLTTSFKGLARIKGLAWNPWIKFLESEEKWSKSTVSSKSRSRVVTWIFRMLES